MNENLKRRKSDVGQQEEINELIRNEQDPKNRAFLLVLQQIHQSLIANTETVNDVASKLDKHLTTYEQHAEAEEARINQGRGLWRVLAWMLGLLQVLVLTALGTAYHEVQLLHDHIAKDQVMDMEIVRKTCKEEVKK